MDPVTLTLAPGENGTKGLLSYFGVRLVCVRYRKKPTGQTYKTIELRLPADPTPMLSSGVLPYYLGERLVKLRIELQEQQLQTKVKAAGGRWNPKEKLWVLEESRAEDLGLRGRIVHREQN